MEYTWFVMGIILVIIAILMNADKLVIITLILLTATNWLQEYQNNESQENFHINFDNDESQENFYINSNESQEPEPSIVPVPATTNTVFIDDSDDPEFVMYDVSVSYSADDMAVRQGRARNYLERSIDGQMNRMQLLKSYVEEELNEAEESNGWYGASEY